MQCSNWNANANSRTYLTTRNELFLVALWRHDTIKTPFSYAGGWQNAQKDAARVRDVCLAVKPLSCRRPPPRFTHKHRRTWLGGGRRLWYCICNPANDSISISFMHAFNSWSKILQNSCFVSFSPLSWRNDEFFATSPPLRDGGGGGGWRWCALPFRVRASFSSFMEMIAKTVEANSLLWIYKVIDILRGRC